MVNIHKVKQEICDIGDRLYKKASPRPTTAISATA